MHHEIADSSASNVVESVRESPIFRIVVRGFLREVIIARQGRTENSHFAGQMFIKEFVDQFVPKNKIRDKKETLHD